MEENNKQSEMFPDHPMFKTYFGIDKVLLSYNNFGILNVASNADDFYYMILDTENPDTAEELTSISWAFIPLDIETYNFYMEADKDEIKDVHKVYDLIFKNDKPLIYTTVDFKNPSKNVFDELEVTESSPDKYPFMKRYRDLCFPPESTEG